MPVYPNRERALSHIKRTQAAYLYGRFPQRYVQGHDLPDPKAMYYIGQPQWCCDSAFLALSPNYCGCAQEASRAPA